MLFSSNSPVIFLHRLIAVAACKYRSWPKLIANRGRISYQPEQKEFIRPIAQAIMTWWQDRSGQTVTELSWIGQGTLECAVLLRIRSAHSIRDRGFGLDKVRIYGRNLHLLDIIGLNAWQTGGDHLCPMFWAFNRLEVQLRLVSPLAARKIHE